MTGLEVILLFAVVVLAGLLVYRWLHDKSTPSESTPGDNNPYIVFKWPSVILGKVLDLRSLDDGRRWYVVEVDEVTQSIRILGDVRTLHPGTLEGLIKMGEFPKDLEEKIIWD